MKILNLIMKQKYFDEILSGKKTEEYREIRPTTFRKYCNYLVGDKEYARLEDCPEFNEEVEDGNEDSLTYEAVPKHFDALRLYVGYNKDRDSMLVEVKDYYILYYTDENDENISYTTPDGQTYLMCDMVYVLGKILEKDIHPKD
ncbi:MAG: ASCH domain-containing protein [Muribaculaceae bacterium]|nr:ASCH domain-containing protein [Muribaculaceae bacterium]